jgi:hypothetical protein
MYIFVISLSRAIHLYLELVKGHEIEEDFQTIEDGTDRLSRNVGTELPLNAALCPRRAQISCTSPRKPEVRIKTFVRISENEWEEGWRYASQAASLCQVSRHSFRQVPVDRPTVRSGWGTMYSGRTTRDFGWSFELQSSGQVSDDEGNNFLWNVDTFLLDCYVANDFCNGRLENLKFRKIHLQMPNVPVAEPFYIRCCMQD